MTDEASHPERGPLEPEQNEPDKRGAEDGDPAPSDPGDETDAEE